MNNNIQLSNPLSEKSAVSEPLLPDRFGITSAGGLADGLSQVEFFEGFSVPRNKELMRVFIDLGMVEQLGSGVPRILENYNKDNI